MRDLYAIFHTPVSALSLSDIALVGGLLLTVVLVGIALGYAVVEVGDRWARR